MDTEFLRFKYERKGSIVSYYFSSGSSRVVGLTGAITPLLIKTNDTKTKNLLTYRIYALYFSFNSSIGVYRDTMEKLFKKASDDKFKGKVYYNNNAIGDDNIALKLSIANIINTTAELYESLRFCLGDKAYANLSVYLKNNKEYTGDLRDNLIKQEWDTIKHQFGLNVEPIKFDATDKTFTDPSITNLSKLQSMPVNDFYEYVLDDVYKIINEINTVN